MLKGSTAAARMQSPEYQFKASSSYVCDLITIELQTVGQQSRNPRDARISTPREVVFELSAQLLSHRGLDTQY